MHENECKLPFLRKRWGLPGAQVHSDMLEDVASSLGSDIDRSDSEIYKISNGIYVHTYNSTVKCSSVSCKRFFQLHHCTVNSPCGVKC